MPMCNFNKFFCNFIEITFRHGCSPVNLLHIFRTSFPKNTSGRLLLIIAKLSILDVCGDPGHVFTISMMHSLHVVLF